VDSWLSSFDSDLDIKHVVWVLWGLMALAGLHFINYLFRYQLNYLGIIPRRWRGLPGIMFSPWLHGDFNHLFFNAIPLFMLANFILLQGEDIFFSVSLIIILLSGALVWLLGRRAYHVGASSLIMGYWGFLLLNVYQQGTIMAIILGFVCIYYLGGLFSNLLPGRRGVSWEGHVFGFIAGLAANFLSPILLNYWYNLHW